MDHCSMSNCTDGLIDAVESSTNITISNNYLTHHKKVSLDISVTRDVLIIRIIVDWQNYKISMLICYFRILGDAVGLQ